MINEIIMKYQSKTNEMIIQEDENYIEIIV
jgi:hypothetical protein